MTGDKEEPAKHKVQRKQSCCNCKQLKVANSPVLIPIKWNRKTCYVPEMQKNLVPISQLTSTGKFVMFGPDGVKVYQDLEVNGKLLMEGREMDFIYIMLAEDAYMDKQRHSMTECIDSIDEQCHTVKRSIIIEGT